MFFGAVNVEKKMVDTRKNFWLGLFHFVGWTKSKANTNILNSVGYGSTTLNAL